MTQSGSLEGPVQLSTPIRFQDPLPDATDVVVIGGGVMGIFSALYMARAGLKVVVCEKGRIACEQSSRNWGWIRQHGRDAAELPIMMEASRLWEETDRETGGKTGFKRTGVCYLASNEAALERRAKWLDIARDHQLDTRLLTRKQVGDLIDQGGRSDAHQWIGATYTPGDARAEPWQAVPAIAEMAQACGVLIRENCAVRGMNISAGIVRGVYTEAGKIDCEQAVLAGGAWSSLFAHRHGISIPQLSVRSTVCKTAPMAEVFAGNASDENFAFRRRADGGYTLAGEGRHQLMIGPDAFRHFFKYLPVATAHLHETSFAPAAPKGYPDAWGIARSWYNDEASPFEHVRVLDPKPNQRQIKRIVKSFAARFPHLGEPNIQATWAGMIDTMPDVVPIIDRVAQQEGLIVATGLSGHGFGIGPGFGKIVSLLAQGKQTGHDISRFRFSRFSDGSKIVPGPSI